MTENDDKQHPKSYSEDDNYFEQNKYPVQTNMNLDIEEDIEIETEPNDAYDSLQTEAEKRNNKADTEFAAEAVILNPSERDPDLMRRKEQETRMQENVEAGWGWIALVIALLSFFVWPLVFATVGAVLGIYAKRRGANTLGNIAIGLAIVSVAMWLILSPIL